MECKAKHIRLDQELHYSAIIVPFLQGAILQCLNKWRIWIEEIINMMVDITKKNIQWMAEDATNSITYYNSIFFLFSFFCAH